MKLLMNIAKVFLILFLSFLLVKYFFIYKDVIFSINSKGELRGKIVYSARGWYIKIIEFPEGKTKTIYETPPEVNRRYGFVHSPYFSPDGSRIVFSQSDYLFDDKLYIIDSDGQNKKLFLDLNGMSALCPSWSPDGQTIAYVVERDGSQGLYAIKIADRSIARISDIQPLKTQPAWSPDSKKIAFDSKQEQRKPLKGNFYEVRDMGGTYIIDMLSNKIEKYFDLVEEPAWSPDGKMFAYGDKFGFHIIDLEDIASGDRIFISHSKILFGIGGAFPIRWSPDGKYIVFCKEIWSGIAGIYVVSIDNPKKRIRVGTDKLAIIGMSWAN
jgi:Tol biopolymer transport system component